jgi:hypothetical protein
MYNSNIYILLGKFDYVNPAVEAETILHEDIYPTEETAEAAKELFLPVIREAVKNSKEMVKPDTIRIQVIRIK